MYLEGKCIIAILKIGPNLPKYLPKGSILTASHIKFELVKTHNLVKIILPWVETGDLRKPLVRGVSSQ